MNMCYILTVCFTFMRTMYNDLLFTQFTFLSTNYVSKLSETASKESITYFEDERK